MEYIAADIEAERKKLKQAKKASTKNMKKKTTTPKTEAPKQPRAIKLVTIYKVLLHTFAIIGVVLSIVFINNAINDYIDTQAEARAAEMVKAAELKDQSKQ